MNENTLEIAALGWFEALGCEVRNVTCALMGNGTPWPPRHGGVCAAGGFSRPCLSVPVRVPARKVALWPE